jgi:hypothetical protein
MKINFILILIVLRIVRLLRILILIQHTPPSRLSPLGGDPGGGGGLLLWNQYQSPANFRLKIRYSKFIYLYLLNLL